jgi:hypothetical protein
VSRSRIGLIIGVVVLLGLAGATILLSTQSAPPVVPAAVASPPSLTGEERAFYESVSPELRAAAAEARQLTTKGEQRDRNLFAIRAGQGRLRDHLAVLDQSFAATVPERFAPVVAMYKLAVVDIRASMSQAEAAFLRFDWDAVGAATELMANGTAQLEAAVAQFDGAAGATPVAANATPGP